MTDFSYLAGLNPADQTATMPLYDLNGDISLEVRYAGETNKPFFNALLKKAIANQRATGGKVENVKADMIERNRSEDRELFRRFIIVGWTNVRDSAGNLVEFSEAACGAFLEALPNWIFDKIRAWVATPENFVEGYEAPDAAELAKN